MKKLPLVGLLIFLTLPFQLLAQQNKAAPTSEPHTSSNQRIVSSSGLRVRSEADTNSTVVARLPLGATLPCLSRGKEKTIGEMTGAFCQTRPADGKLGYFF